MKQYQPVRRRPNCKVIRGPWLQPYRSADGILFPSIKTYRRYHQRVAAGCMDWA
ncbi:hypothetical protein D5125_17110 [Magnetovirga frankeli]|uniref:hypothetical protein n=1 Tax=Magnetovirga frankeli TaxID=947516 RepID=UPI0012931E62|nr:hypothetical protein D5125_17110 [gamma proteobacterium SS-5]